MQNSSLSSGSEYTSLFEIVDIPVPSALVEMTPGVTENLPLTKYILRTQSSRLCDDTSTSNVSEIDSLLQRDIQDRIVEVGDGISADLFPDEAFGFPINDQFVKNFCGSVISSSKLVDTGNFKNEEMTATFLNRMVTTIADFLHSTKKTSLKPLRYFSAQATKPIQGSPVKVKPDILTVPLIDGCIREGGLGWKEVQSIIEHTQERKAPPRMRETIRTKTYMTFCNQPERDFIPFLCILKDSFYIVVSDHSGQIETFPTSFGLTGSTLVFFRLVMGLAFLPSSYLGLDPTIFRRDDSMSSAKKMSDAYPPYNYDIPNPNIKLFVSDSSTIITSKPNFDWKGDKGIVSISINDKTYKVIRILFHAQTLIGRATKAFLVEFPDGRLGVLKDSWILSGRANEASFLKGLDIPFGPQLVDYCVLGNTRTFRDNPITMCLKPGYRTKQRILTYPAGVHISDFSCLWELMAALLDIVICMFNFIILFDHSTNFDMLFSHILSRIPQKDSP